MSAAWLLFVVGMVALLLVYAEERRRRHWFEEFRRRRVLGRYSFAPGHEGDPWAWCYWDRGYPEDGACGPFATRDEAIEHAMAAWREEV